MENYGYNSIQKDKLSQKDVLNFWKYPISKEGDNGNNQPSHYAEGDDRSIYLVKLIKKYLNLDSKILELGCNIGRNLKFLCEAGYTNLYGIEINEEAVQLMATFYPAMSNQVTVTTSPIERAVKDISDKKFDLVFSMAVLEHIHYDSDFIFQEIKRISGKCILTIEDEKTTWSNRHFPRNYKDIFEDKEWVQASEINCGKLMILDDRFWVRVFLRRNYGIK